MAAIGTGTGDDFGTCKYCGGTTFNGCCLTACADSCGQVPGTDAAHGDSCDCQACSDNPLAGWDEDTQTWGDDALTQQQWNGFHTCPMCRRNLVNNLAGKPDDTETLCTACAVLAVHTATRTVTAERLAVGQDATGES